LAHFCRYQKTSNQKKKESDQIKKKTNDTKKKNSPPKRQEGEGAGIPCCLGRGGKLTQRQSASRLQGIVFLGGGNQEGEGGGGGTALCRQGEKRDRGKGKGRRRTHPFRLGEEEEKKTVRRENSTGG